MIALPLRRGAPWAELDLSDGTTVSVMAIQGSDGDRAKTAGPRVPPRPRRPDPYRPQRLTPRRPVRNGWSKRAEPAHR